MSSKVSSRLEVRLNGTGPALTPACRAGFAAGKSSVLMFATSAAGSRLRAPSLDPTTIN